ncbi:GNAT family N-acetyltransferase [Hamadaea sp. NPDC050747]|uniref:GNAT family N-acetyltransferase n=1 Tax=Hamadaea sp. NPDC050747 TaxID=3155789 RepID=UPI0033FA4476
MDVVARARQLWEVLADRPGSFPGSGAAVVVAPASKLCPPGWCGTVTIGGATLVTCPDEWSAEQMRGAVPWEELAAATLGPAHLAYLDPARFRPAGAADAVVKDELRQLLSVVDEEEADECGLEEIDSLAYMLERKGEIVAAAGYRRWPDDVAHLCVLTHPAHRGRGLARRVASAAVEAALSEGLFAQWRARPVASRKVAAALGFEDIGTQFSLRLKESR